MADVAVHRAADPDVQLDFAPGAGLPANAAAAALVLMLMTLALNAMAIWLRYRLRKEHQMVSDGPPERKTPMASKRSADPTSPPVSKKAEAT